MQLLRPLIFFAFSFLFCTAVFSDEKRIAVKLTNEQLSTQFELEDQIEGVPAKVLLRIINGTGKKISQLETGKCCLIRAKESRCQAPYSVIHCSCPDFSKRDKGFDYRSQ